VHFSGASKKLEILSAAAKYDVSCSSSGSNRKIPKEAWETQHLSVYAIAGLMTEGVFLFKNPSYQLLRV